MNKICVIIGHGGKDKGAFSQDKQYNELDYNTEICELLVNELNKINYVAFKHNRGNNRMENIPLINSLRPDLIISLHCNSADNIKATGTEVIHYEFSKNGKRFAEILSKNVSKTLGLKNRGAKYPFNGRGSGLLRSTNAPCVILESFFISNDNDLKIGLENKKELVEAIIDSINEYFK